MTVQRSFSSTPQLDTITSAPFADCKYPATRHLVRTFDAVRKFIQKLGQQYGITESAYTVHLNWRTADSRGGRTIGPS